MSRWRPEVDFVERQPRTQDGGLHLVRLRHVGQDGDGFAVLREWRAKEALAKIPVVMLTARNREEDVVGAFEGGAVDYLTKPFSPAELVARVKRVMADATQS